MDREQPKKKSAEQESKVNLEELEAVYLEVFDMMCLYEDVIAELKNIPELRRLVHNTLERHFHKN